MITFEEVKEKIDKKIYHPVFFSYMTRSGNASLCYNIADNKKIICRIVVEYNKSLEFDERYVSVKKSKVPVFTISGINLEHRQFVKALQYEALRMDFPLIIFALKYYKVIDDPALYFLSGRKKISLIAELREQYFHYFTIPFCNQDYDHVLINKWYYTTVNNHIYNRHRNTCEDKIEYIQLLHSVEDRYRCLAKNLPRFGVKFKNPNLKWGSSYIVSVP